MKLLQINSTLNSGSTGRIAEQIGKVAIQNGWESYVAYGRHHNPSSSYEICIGSKWDTYVHGAFSLLTDKHGLASTNVTKSFINSIKSIRPDIIHLHNIHGYYLNYKLLFEYLSEVNIPIVWTLHDCWAITGHCAYFESVSCNKWKTSCEQCPLKSSYPRSLFFDNSMQNYQMKKYLFTKPINLTVITVSEWLKGIVEQSFMSKYPIYPIYNGVDTSIFKPVPFQHLKCKLKCEDKKILIGVATAWSVRKGLFDYYRLANKFTSDIQIILVGLNEKQLKTLPNNIIGVKRTESLKELAEFYSMADIVLNLYYEETFGLTTVEGFACGTPSIVYDKTASPELITSNTGKIIEAGNIELLYDAINEILKIGKATYSEACRHRAVTYFDSQSNYQQYVNLYNKIIN